jgi:hypothetical protein
LGINKVFAGFIALLALIPAAHASTISFSLNQDGCTGTCGVSPFSSVSITDFGSGAGAYVQVTDTLSSTDAFVKTGAGDALEFQLSSAPSSIVVDTTGFTATSGTQTASAFGSFSNGIVCSGCDNGGSSPLSGPLTFDVYGVTTADFVANSKGYLFASDIMGSNGKTGNVAANSAFTPQSAAPEPGSVTLLLSGLLLVGSGSFRKKVLSAS